MENIVEQAANILRSRAKLGSSRKAADLQELLDKEKNPKVAHMIVKMVSHYRTDLQEMRTISKRGLYERLTEIQQRDLFAQIKEKKLKPQIAEMLKDVLRGVREDEYRDLYGDGPIPKVV